MKKIGLILSLLLMFTAINRADIAPDPGFTKVLVNLNFVTKEDFSDYRFFLDFYGDAREVEIKKGANSIPSMGGGARYSIGSLWAIPKKSLKDENKEQISNALNENNIPGAIKLAQHSFVQTVRNSEIEKIQNPLYMLERDVEKGLKITQQGGTLKLNGGGHGMDFTVYGTVKRLTTFGYIVLVSFPAAAIVILGIWLFKKKGRKLN